MAWRLSCCSFSLIHGLQCSRMMSWKGVPRMRNSAGPWWVSSEVGSQAVWLRSSFSFLRQDLLLLLQDTYEIDTPAT